ncbi:MAG: cysteine hydrolase [Betaproteobacteria bacterium]
MSQEIQRRIGLVIVDLQNDFLSQKGAYVRGKTVSSEAILLPERLVPLAQAVKKNQGLVTASLFTLWPDADGQPMISPHLLERRPFLRKGDFAPGSWGQANVDVLAPLIDVSVCKVAYSAFFNTQLDWILRRAGINTVVVCGIVTNGGVASTVRDAHMRDYQTVVLSDGCATFTETAHQAALIDMSSVAQVMTCHQFLATL